jgi:serine/threonine-protein kinase RsbW
MSSEPATVVPPEVLLTMPARAEGVGVVRQALTGVADALDFDASVLADMKMAVTEACTNVVVHAYEDEGMLEVEMLAGADGLTIVVRDHGAGIQPRPARAGAPALGLGLPLIAALSDAFELRGSAGRGTEVRMTFAYARERDPAQANPVTGTVGDDGRWDPDAPTPG